MNIDDILDAMDEMLDRAWNLPLTGGRCVVDAEKVRDLIDDIRLNMPAEIKQAKQIVADRADIISVAKKEAEGFGGTGRDHQTGTGPRNGDIVPGPDQIPGNAAGIPGVCGNHA